MAETLRFATFLDKGGTGKTTTAAHLGVALANHDHDVLLVDLAGKQSDLAKYFGLYDDWQATINDDGDDSDWPNIATTLTDQWSDIAKRIDTPVESMIHDTGEGPDLIPAHPDLDGIESKLSDRPQDERYSVLESVVDEHFDPLGYDVVIFDLPGLTNNVSYNGLCAARRVITPVELGPLEKTQAGRLRDDLERIRDRLGKQVELSMVIPNKVDTRTNLAEEYLGKFRESFPDTLAAEYVVDSQDIRNACDDGTTAFALEDPSTTAQQARDAYTTIAETLIETHE